MVVIIALATGMVNFISAVNKLDRRNTPGSSDKSQVAGLVCYVNGGATATDQDAANFEYHAAWCLTETWLACYPHNFVTQIDLCLVDARHKWII